jgi:hypothetical protein
MFVEKNSSKKLGTTDSLLDLGANGFDYEGGNVDFELIKPIENTVIVA